MRATCTPHSASPQSTSGSFGLCFARSRNVGYARVHWPSCWSFVASASCAWNGRSAADGSSRGRSARAVLMAHVAMIAAMMHIVRMAHLGVVRIKGLDDTVHDFRNYVNRKTPRERRGGTSTNDVPRR